MNISFNISDVPDSSDGQEDDDESSINGEDGDDMSDVFPLSAVVLERNVDNR